jgi:hypothetical protein
MHAKRSVAFAAAAASAAALAVVAWVGPAGATASSRPSAVTVIASHLDNPRGLAVSGDRIYIAESGHGDPMMCLPLPPGPPQPGPPPQNCVGLTGKVSSVSEDAAPSTAVVKTVISGLFSISDVTGTASAGPSAVSVAEGRLFAIMAGNTAGAPPSVPPNFASLLKAAKAQLGQLIVATGKQRFKAIAGVGDSDYKWSAAHANLVPGQFPDSNPNAVYAADDVQYVIDAGSNTLDTVRGGRVVARVFFPVPAGSVTDSVPTCVDRGPDGALYVAELLGGSFTPGKARVWRVVPGHKPTVWATGLTTVNGCGFGSDGKFYAAEFQTAGLMSTAPAGDVVRISNNGKKLTHLAVGLLNFPSGFAAGDDGIYVSNCSIAPAKGFGPCPIGGQLVRIRSHS